MLYLTDKIDPNLLKFPDNSEDKYIICYSTIKEERVLSLLKVNRYRVLINNKKIIQNVFEQIKPPTIKTITSFKLKTFDYIITPLNNGLYQMLEVVPIKNLLRSIK